MEARVRLWMAMRFQGSRCQPITLNLSEEEHGHHLDDVEDGEGMVTEMKGGVEPFVHGPKEATQMRFNNRLDRHSNCESPTLCS